MMLILSITFAAVALLYAMVGFGGGTSYIALLILFNTPFQVVPLIGLVCNLIVVSGGIAHFVSKGLLSFKELLPFVVTSIPAAYLGGSIDISRDNFVLVLGIILTLAGAQLFISPPRPTLSLYWRERLFWLPWLIGSAIGFFSGLVGIGGGIFLSPCLLSFGWTQPKQVAAISSGFILVNSVAGLVGQLSKQANLDASLPYWPCLIAVFVGGQAGSYLITKKLQPIMIQKLMAIVILFVACRLLLF
jgi:uncharacterized membrane protein YfcA